MKQSWQIVFNIARLIEQNIPLNMQNVIYFEGRAFECLILQLCNTLVLKIIEILHKEKISSCSVFFTFYSRELIELSLFIK